MNELVILRETCKNFPQQYQAYINVMGEAYKSYPFEGFVEWVFGYRPNSANVNSLRNNQQSTSLEEHEIRKISPLVKRA